MFESIRSSISSITSKNTPRGKAMEWLMIAGLVLILLSNGQPHKRRKRFDDEFDRGPNVDKEEALAIDYLRRMDEKEDK